MDETRAMRFERWLVERCKDKGAFYATRPVSQLAAEFAESEVRAALAPRDASPDLVKRLVEIMSVHADDDGVPTIKYAALAELLVDEVARLSQPASAQGADWCKLASDLRDAVMATTPSGEDVAAGTAAKVAEACVAVRDALNVSAPAQDRATRVVWEGWAVVVAPGKTAQPPELCAREVVAQARAKTVNACGYEATVERVSVTAERAGKDGTRT